MRSDELTIPKDQVHAFVHNHDALFYTLHPPLLIAITRAFLHVHNTTPHLLTKRGYYEFGLFKGFSFWFAEVFSRDITGPDFRLIGFDSFAGLPESAVDEHRNWQKGSYAASYDEVVGHLQDNEFGFARAQLVQGFFSKQLFTRFLDVAPTKPAILVVDSDIYESCRLILDSFGPELTTGAVLIFDDFNAFDRSNDHGERRALREFELEHPSFRKGELFSFGKWGEAFEVL